MKIANIAAALALVTAPAAFAEHFKCAELAASAASQNRPQYAVFLTSLGRITDGRVVGRWDYAERVRVSLLARNPMQPQSHFALVRPSFEAVAKSEDVMYFIDAWQQTGFKMKMYLDELNETSVQLNGIRGTLRMNCMRAG